MFTSEQLYFLKNREWYEEIDDEDDIYGIGYKLTDKAPPQAVEAYNKYVEILKNSIKAKKDKNGNIVIEMTDF